MSGAVLSLRRPTSHRHAVLRAGVLMTATLLVLQLGSMLRLQIDGASTRARLAVAGTDRAVLAIVKRDLEGGRGGNRSVPIVAAADDRVEVESAPDHRVAQLPCVARPGSNGARRIAYRFHGDTLERRVQCLVEGRWRVEVADAAVLAGLGPGSGRIRYFDLRGAELTPGPEGLDLRARTGVGRVRIEWVDPDGVARPVVDALVRGGAAFRVHLQAALGEEGP